MKHRLLIAIATLMMLWGTSASAAASPQKCQETMSKFRQLGNVPELLSQSYGYAVLPTIGKGGAGIGGAGGTGCVYAGGKHVGNVYPWGRSPSVGNWAASHTAS